MTGRLINADKLRAWFESHSVWDEFPVGYIMGLIDEQPTVEAIPVEWMRQYIDEHGLYTTAMEAITAWSEQRKEE